MEPIEKLEDSLEKTFKGLPQLPKNWKKGIVQYLPWITLVIGVLTIWSAYSVWHWAHWVNAWADYANNLSRAFGGSEVVSSRMTVGIWVSVVVLAIEAVIYILAFPALKATKKMGWNMLFYGSLVNVVYGVVILFTNYGGVSNLVWSIISTAIGWYFLFQIREYYTGKKLAEVKAEEKKEKK